MISNKVIGSLTLVTLTVLLLAGCGQPERAAPAETTAPLGQQATSIDRATVGQVTGKVVFDGTPPKLDRIYMSKDPVCESMLTEPLYVEDGKVNTDGTLPNVFLHITGGAEKYSFAKPTTPVVLDQKGCLFEPHVLGIMVGQELRVLSSDPTAHNVHAMAKQNREWNQTQQPGGAPLSQRFTQPEIMVPVKCLQHPWMKAYIGVTRNPFFAVTGNDGTFTIKGLPAGDYTLEAWTATFGTQRLQPAVKPGQTTTVNFTFKTP